MSYRLNEVCCLAPQLLATEIIIVEIRLQAESRWDVSKREMDGVCRSGVESENDREEGRDSARRDQERMARDRGRQSEGDGGQRHSFGGGIQSA